MRSDSFILIPEGRTYHLAGNHPVDPEDLARPERVALATAAG
jgi:hypothetical protein